MLMARFCGGVALVIAGSFDLSLVVGRAADFLIGPPRIADWIISNDPLELTHEAVSTMSGTSGNFADGACGRGEARCG